MSRRIAVVGNPNSGKTTLFNALSGARAHVGNYPGVTVERREAQIDLGDAAQALLIDLPGCYSLTARSSEEEIAHRVLLGDFGTGSPDRVLCVVDATQLARGLYLVFQLLELGLPCVVVLTMLDTPVAHKLQIDIQALQRHLGIPVVGIGARTGMGLEALKTALKAPMAKVPVVDFGLSDSQTHALQQVVQAWHATPALQQTHTNAFGHSLWLVTSQWSRLRQPLPRDLAQAIQTCCHQLDPNETGAFKRQVIIARYQRVDTLLAKLFAPGVLDEVDIRTQHIDRILLHPVWGFAIFMMAMFCLFQIVFTVAQPFIEGISTLMAWINHGLENILPASHTRSLLTHGLVAGIGNILAFLPQIAFLFAGLTVLEESGYLARAAFLLDRLMQRVGLHGKAFIPLMSSFACAIPGILATRTLESKRDRMITIFIAPFMSCSARLPVYTLVIAAVFGDLPPLFGFLSVGGLLIFGMYLLGFVVAIATAFVLKRTLLRTPSTALLLELPVYRLPDAITVWRNVFERCQLFIGQTGRVILTLSVLLWALLTFPQTPLPQLAERQAQIAQLTSQTAQEQAQQALERQARAYNLEHSFGGQLGHLLEPWIAPLGFDWRIGIGLVASFAARETLVSTLGQIYALDADTDADSPSLHTAMKAERDPETGRSAFTPLVGLSLMVFFVLALQCLSTLATVRRETQSWSWALFQLLLMNTLAYGASFAVYQGGRLLGFQ